MTPDEMTRLHKRTCPARWFDEGICSCCWTCGRCEYLNVGPICTHCAWTPENTEEVDLGSA